jgi:hypothetical protein
VNVLFVFFFECFFYDKITKNKEEFNILICSRLRIMNLHVGMSKKTKKPIKLRKPEKNNRKNRTEKKTEPNWKNRAKPV